LSPFLQASLVTTIYYSSSYLPSTSRYILLLCEVWLVHFVLVSWSTPGRTCNNSYWSLLLLHHFIFNICWILFLIIRVVSNNKKRKLKKTFHPGHHSFIWVIRGATAYMGCKYHSIKLHLFISSVTFTCCSVLLLLCIVRMFPWLHHHYHHHDFTLSLL
jgi:hypothetical protein